jgi:hypothetical protein
MKYKNFNTDIFNNFLTIIIIYLLLLLISITLKVFIIIKNVL